MDSHHKFHIAHACFWEGGVQPFTLISNESVRKGEFKPVNSECMDWVLKYTEELEKKGKFMLCIWPEHCLIGSPGHNVNSEISIGLDHWLKETNSRNPNDNGINFVLKGQNKMTEMYSCMSAEVIVEEDKSTHFNKELMERLVEREGKIVVVGQASSHCVNFSVRDIVRNWPKDCKKGLVDLVILKDCMSPVPGFETAEQEFFMEMGDAGCTVCTSEAFMSGWE